MHLPWHVLLMVCNKCHNSYPLKSKQVSETLLLGGEEYLPVTPIFLPVISYVSMWINYIFLKFFCHI